MTSQFPLNISEKEDYPPRIAELEGVDSKYYILASEFNNIRDAIIENFTNKLASGGYNGTAQDLRELIDDIVTGDLTASQIGVDGFIEGYPYRQNSQTVDGALRGLSLINTEFLKAFGIPYSFDNVNPSYYATLSALYESQSNQIENALYFVKSINGILRYTGTTNGDASDYEVQELSQSGLRNVSDNAPNIDSSVDAYKTGRLGIGESNPEEQLDVLGSIKQQYTYPSGELVRTTLGGLNNLSEDGLPSGVIKTWLLDFRGHPVLFPGLRSYAFGGDINAINPTSGAMSMGAGIANLENSKYARLNIFTHTFNNDPQNDFIAALQVAHKNGNRATLLLKNKGSSTGHNLEPTIEAITTGTNNSSVFRLTPHALRFDKLLQLEGYGNKIFVENYEHTDNSADTGTSHTSIGALNLIGTDQDGNVGEYKNKLVLKDDDAILTIVTDLVNPLPTTTGHDIVSGFRLQDTDEGTDAFVGVTNNPSLAVHSNFDVDVRSSQGDIILTAQRVKIDTSVLQLDKNAGVPLSSTDTGEQGDLVADDDYIYFCIAPNVWKRAPLNTW